MNRSAFVYDLDEGPDFRLFECQLVLLGLGDTEASRPPLSGHCKGSAPQVRDPEEVTADRQAGTVDVLRR